MFLMIPLIEMLYGPKLSLVEGKWQRPWVTGGDFNIIRFSSKKKGGCTLSIDMRDFSDWIRQRELILIDLHMDGSRYPWTNKQQVPIMSKLDRFLVSPS